MLIQQKEVCFHNTSSLTNVRFVVKNVRFVVKKGRGKEEQREMSRKHYLHELLLCSTLLCPRSVTLLRLLGSLYLSLTFPLN